MQVLGLQLSNYVPDTGRLGGSSWEGVVARQPALHSMFRQHVVVPLLEGAQDLPSAASMDEAGGPVAGGPASKAPGAGWPSWMPVDRRTTFSVVLPTVAVTAVTVAAIAVVVARRSRHRHAL